MHKLNQKGELLIPLVIVSVLLLSVSGFGVWAYTGRQDYKNNVDKKVQEAVVAAEEALSIKKDAEFTEIQKLPYTDYSGPSAFGTLVIPHPKNWSVYVDEEGNSSQPVNGYMHPGKVPADDATNFAIRFQVVEQSYEQNLKNFESNVKQGKVSSAGYRLPKVQTVLGTRLEGEIVQKKQGVLILIPLRDKTIKFWTEGNEFRGDFEEILKQFTFIP